MATETVTSGKQKPEPAGKEGVEQEPLDRQLAEQLLEQARAQGVQLVGPDGLLSKVTKTVLETALEAEMEGHLGYERNSRAGRGSGNSRNGKSGKTVMTDVGPVTLEVPRDRNGTFAPQIVPKRARRLDGFNEAIISLYAKGLTTGDIQAHLLQVYGAEVSRDLISRVTDAVSEELSAWQSRPLDRVYPVIFIDAIVVKIRDGAVANRPVYVAVGVTLDGDRDVLGMWVGTGGEGAKHWFATLTELRNRGVTDVFLVCCDGLPGLPDAVTATWPNATVQTCVVHMVRNALRYASRKDWSAITADMRTIYTAPTVDAAHDRFTEFADRWGGKYPAIIKSWKSAWGEFVPFLSFAPEIRRVVYTTNMIESLNARYRKATRVRGHFPNEQAALKVLYLVTRDRSAKGGNITGRITGWKQALNAFAITYGDRIH